MVINNFDDAIIYESKSFQFDSELSSFSFRLRIFTAREMFARNES